MKNKKTLNEWIEIANKCKKIRKELMSLSCDSLLPKQLNNHLCNAILDIDKYRCGCEDIMYKEHFLGKNQDDEFLSIFYGDE